MKYVSLIMVIILVALSWMLIRPKDGLSAEQHARLQQVMGEYLKVYVQEKEPTATNMLDPQVNTRVIDAGKTMVADFRITYDIPAENGPHTITRAGSFSLVSDNGQNWTAKLERMDDSQVQFSDADAISISLSDSKAAAVLKEEEKAEKKEKEETAPQEQPAH